MTDMERAFLRLEFALRAMMTAVRGTPIEDRFWNLIREIANAEEAFR